MRYLRLMSICLCVCVFVPLQTTEARDKSGVLKASQLIGMKVEGTDGKKLGDVKDLVLDPDDGSINYAVLDFGGIAGIGDKYFAVPWPTLNITPDKKKLLLDVTKRELKDAPGFDKNNWPDLNDQQQVVTIYEFYEIPMPEGRGTSRVGK